MTNTRHRGLRLWFLLGLFLLLGLIARADAIRDLEKKQGLYADFAANLRVQMIGNRLALADNLPNARFKIINDTNLNAMALPDGRIYITSVMATNVTDDELAFVLGHELTHVKEKHASNQISKATGGMILGAILVAILGGSNADIRTGADIAGGLTYGHYSRQDELAADNGGVKLMTICGYDPKKAADAMQRLIDRYGAGDANTPILGWFATHPDSRERKKRILAQAAKLEAKPPRKLDDPLGIELTLDPSAEHTSPWIYSYFSNKCAIASRGKVVALPWPGDPMIAPILPEMLASGEPAVIPGALKASDTPAKPDPKKPLEALPVKVTVPVVPHTYSVRLSARQIPPERETSLETAKGTAVEISLAWTDLRTGMAGVCAARAQTNEKVGWRAEDQLHPPLKLTKLYDGVQDNLEGALEAIAMCRAVRAFGEVVTANGAVNHSAPVKLKIKPSSVRLDDYVEVMRGGIPVAGVYVTATDNKTVTGSVLWGTHTWKKADEFVVQR